MAVIHAAHVRDIDKGAARGQAADGGTISTGLLHLGKTARRLAKHEHDLGHTLIGGEAQGRGRRGQRVGLRRG